jgi:hypothetical protein
MSTAIAYSQTQEPQTEQEAAALIRQSVESDNAPEARLRANEFVARFPDSKELQHWARVLAPGKSYSLPRGVRYDHGADDDWIRDNAAKYPGNWMALRGGVLLAIGPELSKVRRQVADLGVPEEEVLLWAQPREQRR